MKRVLWYLGCPFVLLMGCDTEEEFDVHPTVTDLKPVRAEFAHETGVDAVRFVGKDEQGSPIVPAFEELQPVRGVIPAAEMEARRLERIRQGVPAIDLRSPEQRSTDSVLDQAAAFPADAPFELVVILAEPEFDFGRFSTIKEGMLIPVDATPEEKALVRDEEQRFRDAIIAERVAQLQPTQQAFTQAARGLGVVRTVGFWLANHVRLTIPAGRVRSLRNLPNVVGFASVPLTEGTPLNPAGGLEGDDVRIAMRMQSFHDGFYYGQSGNRVDGFDMRVAVIESLNDQGIPNCLMSGHRAFKGWNGGPSRVVVTALCGANGCASENCAALERLHGTKVATLILGEGDQPGFVWPAKEALLYYYRGVVGADFAVQNAVALGVDVINMSFGWDSDNCNMSLNILNLNNLIANALNSGVVTVAAGGGQTDPNCTMWYPSIRPQLIAATAFEPGCVFAGAHNLPADYDESWLSAGVSRGGVDITVNGTVHSLAASLIDLGAPATLDGLPESLPNTWADQTCFYGVTSFSAALLSAATTLLREFYVTLGWNDARIVLTDMMLMGDGYDHASQTKFASGVSRRSGYGRAKVHHPSDRSMTAPWGWGGSAFQIQQGQTVCHTVGGVGAESPLITHLTATLMWFETNHADAADITLSVNDRCPTACSEQGEAIFVAQDYSFNPQKRVRLNQGQIGGKCLEMKVHAFRIPGPPGTTRTVYRADNWSADPISEF